MDSSADKLSWSVRVANSRRAGVTADRTPARDITWIETESREGFYQDLQGDWLDERRANPDRRAFTIATAAQKAKRQTARREADREILQYLSTPRENP